MPLTREQLQSLNVGINEATLLGVEFDPERRIAAATLAVLSLPETGPMADDPRVQFLFRPVGRIVASLREGHWDDPTAELVKFEVTDLLAVVQSFGGLAIYGWEFFDVDDSTSYDRWAKRVSLDYSSGTDGLTHTVELFQSAEHRTLDLRLWFDELMVRTAAGEVISWEEFAAGGKRWWDGLYTGDERTKNSGISPLNSGGGLPPLA